MIGKTTDNKWLWIIFTVFAIVYCDISFINHYLFRTTAWDMGIFNNALYHYAHLRPNISTVIVPLVPKPENLLAGHFEIYPILLAPFYYLFADYTLLVFQIAAILFGGLGIYRYLSFKLENKFIARLGLVHFFMLWGIYSALSFDYHNNVTASMGIPWMLYYFERKKITPLIICLVLIMIGKENMPLFTFFIALGLLAIYFRKDKEKRKIAVWLSIASLTYFVLVLKVFVPAFSDGKGEYPFKFYSALGDTPLAALTHVFIHPLHTFSILFTNHTNANGEDSTKIILLTVILFSGGWAIIYRPAYLLMLTPVFFQKLLSDVTSRWGVYWHYSIEFAPILTIAVFLTIAHLFASGRYLIHAYLLTILFTCVSTFLVLEHKKHEPYNSATYRFYSMAHYRQPDINVKDAYEVLKTIPASASVSAQSNLVPHLAFRDSIYQYPAGYNSDYIILAVSHGGIGCNESQLKAYENAYSDSAEKKIVYKGNNLLIIKKVKR